LRTGKRQEKIQAATAVTVTRSEKAREKEINFEKRSSKRTFTTFARLLVKRYIYTNELKDEKK
jgi:hypothetical protein